MVGVLFNELLESLDSLLINSSLGLATKLQL